MESRPQIKFSLLERLEFYDDPQMKRFATIFPKVQQQDVRPFIQIAVNEMEGRLPSEVGSWDWPGLSPEALAIRRLVQILHREGTHSDKEEIMEYLVSLNLPRPCCEEVVSTVLSHDLFNNIPKTLRLRPSLVSLQWKIDISFCQRNPEDFADVRSKVSNFHRRVRIILLFRFSDGTRAALGAGACTLSRLRHAVASAVRAHTEAERRSRQPVRLTEEEREALEERGETVQGAI